MGLNVNVNVHHNSVTQNASFGDEINSATPEAAGGTTICTGADFYRFNYNWVCGNLSAGDGGGFTHFGFSEGGTIAHNTILFNQSNNPTIPTHGGGLEIMGLPEDGTVCENAAVDIDCPPTIADGTGNLTIDANLIMGNTAESGSGGGIRFQSVNGTDVINNPSNPAGWFHLKVTNNIITNNVAGWDGGGVGIQDAFNLDFINNTVASNDSTASAGVLFNTLGAPLTNAPPPGCTPNPDPTQPQDPSCTFPLASQLTGNQPAGLSAWKNSPAFLAALGTASMTCPAGHPSAAVNGACRTVSYPMMENNLFWQNRSFYIGVGAFGAGNLNQQHVVTLLPTLNQSATGQCVTGATYWDIGVNGDTGPASHTSGFTLSPSYSILTDAGDYPGNLGGNPLLASQYCNGSRVPPENGGLGYNVPAGISDATLPNPVFNLTASATVDEGNNWVNMSYGPLSLEDPNNTVILGNYSITTGSPAQNAASPSVAPATDFFGNPRNFGCPDIGAVELQAGSGGCVWVTGGPLNFGSVGVGCYQLRANPGGSQQRDSNGHPPDLYGRLRTGDRWWLRRITAQALQQRAHSPPHRPARSALYSDRRLLDRRLEP